MTRTMGSSGRTPSMGSVMRTWWRVGTIATWIPAWAATWRAQAPAASMTIGLSIRPRSVSTPSTTPALTWTPVTVVFGSSVAPSLPAAAA
jgi:hypothetical protein